MPTTITHSISGTNAALGDYLDEVKTTNNIETSERRGTNGDIKKVKDFNATNEFSFKGGGNPAVAVGVATLSVEGLTGGVKIAQKFERTVKNNDFDEHDCGGKHYPNATSG
jgi:hypothetical protein